MQFLLSKILAFRFSHFFEWQNYRAMSDVLVFGNFVSLSLVKYSWETFQSPVCIVDACLACAWYIQWRCQSNKHCKNKLLSWRLEHSFLERASVWISTFYVFNFCSLSACLTKFSCFMYDLEWPFLKKLKLWSTEKINWAFGINVFCFLSTDQIFVKNFLFFPLKHFIIFLRYNVPCDWLI